MQEQRRQAYLSLLGIEAYVPRWELEGAKVSQGFNIFQYEYSETNDFNNEEVLINEVTDKFNSQTVNPIQEFKSVDSIFNEFTSAKELAAVKDIFAQEKTFTKSSIQLNTDNQISQQTVKPFALSVWRFDSGLMIVDSRDTQQALPTDLLLLNFFTQLDQSIKLPPLEVIRWPLVENQFSRLTEKDAREEMQTWLSVQQDIHRIKYLWVMGPLAAEYLLPVSESYERLINSDKKITVGSSIVLVSDSLNELLKNPLQKKYLMKISKFLSSAH